MDDKQDRTRGRPSKADLMEKPVFEHLQRLRNAAASLGRPFDPPGKLIKKSIFERWVDGTTFRPSKFIFEEYIRFLNSSYPLSDMGWIAYFNGNPDKIDNFIDICPIISSGLEAHQSHRAAEYGINEFDNKWLETISGIYQLIRPYTGDQDRYVLEVMEIEYKSTQESISKNMVGSTGSVKMYARNLRSAKYIYSGEISLFEPYAFSLMKREHESIEESEAVRCINIFFQKKSREVSSILSGLMLRGTKEARFHKAAIATPFILIRSDLRLGDSLTTRVDESKCSEFSNAYIRDAHFADYSKYVYGVFSKFHILIGELTKKEPRLFWYCKTAFDKLYKYSFDRRSLYTIDQDKLEEILLSDSGKDDAYDVWRELVESEFPELPFRMKGNPKT